MSAKKLKIGLLIDSDEVSAWLFHSLEQIAHSDYAEFSVILKNEGFHKAENSSRFKILWRDKKEFAYQIFNKIDEKLYFRNPDAFSLMNIHSILSGVPLLSIRPVSEGDVDIFHPEDIEKVREFNLDILIKAGFQRLQGEILNTPTYGVWFIEHSDTRKLRGGPPGFWEVVKKWPDTCASLLIARDISRSDRTVYRSRFVTYPFSPARNRNMSFWWSSSFLPRQIELLFRFGKEGFFSETAKFNDEFDFYDQPEYRIPSNLEATRLYFGLLGKNLIELFQRILCQEYWILLINFSKGASLSFGNFKKILPPKDRFWADPHVIQKNGKLYIFIEEYLYKTRKGHISVIEMDFQGNYKDSVRVLEKDYHLSYPFVFEYAGKFYMVPESSANHSIDLYECVQFPYQWEYKMSLMSQVNAVDTTLFYYQGKWWLFTMLCERDGIFPIVDLFLFYADDLFTDNWISHPRNPIISDVTSARPAGKLFYKDGKMYRPSQNCSKAYGYGFNVNEVLCLNETNYLEKKLVIVNPDWDRKLFATHTFTYEDGLIIIDGLFRPSKL